MNWYYRWVLWYSSTFPFILFSPFFRRICIIIVNKSFHYILLKLIFQSINNDNGNPEERLFDSLPDKVFFFYFNFEQGIVFLIWNNLKPLKTLMSETFCTRNYPFWIYFICKTQQFFCRIIDFSKAYICFFLYYKKPFYSKKIFSRDFLELHPSPAQ